MSEDNNLLIDFVQKGPSALIIIIIAVLFVASLSCIINGLYKEQDEK